VFFGPVTQERNRSLTDASLRERGLLAVMAIMILWMGIGSAGFTRRIEPSVTYLLETMERPSPSYDANARQAARPLPAAPTIPAHGAAD
jgi:NADH:ubiquinone oxidoreductase subunit 4 (subunit M)